MLKLDELLKIFNEGTELEMDEDAAEACNYYSQEAQKITCKLNYEYHDLEILKSVMISGFFHHSQLILEKTFTLEKMFSSIQDADSRIREEST